MKIEIELSLAEGGGWDITITRPNGLAWSCENVNGHMVVNAVQAEVASAIDHATRLVRRA